MTFNKCLIFILTKGKKYLILKSIINMMQTQLKPNNFGNGRNVPGQPMKHLE